MLKTAIGPFDVASEEASTAASDSVKKGSKHTSVSAASNASANVVIDEYLPYSSGEEEEEVRTRTFPYTPLPPIYLAPSADSIWPQEGESPLSLESYSSNYRHVFIYDSKGIPLTIEMKRKCDAMGEKTFSRALVPPDIISVTSDSPTALPSSSNLTHAILAATNAILSGISSGSGGAGVGLSSVPVASSTRHVDQSSAPTSPATLQPQSVSAIPLSAAITDESYPVHKKIRCEPVDEFVAPSVEGAEITEGSRESVTAEQQAEAEQQEEKVTAPLAQDQ